MAEIETLIREYARQCPPITVAELEARLESTLGDNDGTATKSLDGPATEIGPDVCESCGADLTMFDLRVPDEVPASPPQKRRAAVLAVAAAILLLVGAVVVADRADDSLETAPASAPSTPEAIPSSTAPEPTPPPEPVALPASVVDSLGFRWSRIPHDEAVFAVDSSNFDAVMWDVTAGGPGLVAVGTDGSHYNQDGFSETADEFGDAAVWTSTDGVTWSRVPHDEEVFGGAALTSVTTGGPGLVAVGEAVSGAAVWTSTDGVTWSRVPHDEEVFARAHMTTVTAGGPGLVATGPSFEEGAQVWTSVNGLDWSRLPDDNQVFANARIRDVTVGGPGLVAVGSFADEEGGVDTQGAVWTSVDGFTWSRVPHNESTFGGAEELWMTAVAAGGPGLVAAGYFANESLHDQGTAVWTSVDGTTWSRVPSDETVWGYGNVTSLVAVDSGLVAVGADYYPMQSDRGGRVWTSPDGITWTRAPHEKFFNYATIASVTVGGPGLVAVGDSFTSDSEAVVWTATPEN